MINKLKFEKEICGLLEKYGFNTLNSTDIKIHLNVYKEPSITVNYNELDTNQFMEMNEDNIPSEGWVD